MKSIKKTQVDKTEKIIVKHEQNDIEQELREMTIEALIQRLNFEESDPKVAKLIQKIIKEKRKENK